MTRDRIASERGISLVVVVAVVVFTVFITATSLLMYSRLQNAEAVQAELKADLRRATEEGAEIERRVTENAIPTGMTWEPGAEAKEQRSRADDELRKRAEAAFAPMDDRLANIAKENQERMKQIDALILDRSRQYGIYPTLQDLAQVAALRVMHAKTYNDQLTLQKQIAEAYARSVEDMKEPVTKGKVDYANFLRAQIAEVNKVIAKEDETHGARKAELTTALDAATKGIEDENVRYGDWELRMKNDIRERIRQLDELKIKEAIRLDVNVAHGKVIKPDSMNKLAFITIGSRDRVVPGLIFVAAKRGDQGRYVYKAELMVKKVWPTHSEVAVTKVIDRNSPVIEGDVILNPLFNTRRPVVVAFAGEEAVSSVRPAHNLKEATRRIAEMGSVVRDTLTLDVDFLIFTESSGQKQMSAYPNFAKAALLGIPYEEASQLYRFLGE
jgi:hypothetical protein